MHSTALWSPRLIGPRHRDGEHGLKNMRWEQDGIAYKLQATPESHLWKVMGPQGMEGVLVVYVDDFLAMGSPKVRDGLLSKIAETWKCSPSEAW